MKKIIIILVTTLLSLEIVSAQDSITVTITETCSPASGVYELDGTLNGKNRYKKFYSDISIDSMYFYISFDSIMWIMYADNTPEVNAFYNINVPTAMLPPNTGWIADICDGTMVIEGGVSIIAIEEIKEKPVTYYISSDNILNVKINKQNNSEDIHIELYNYLGQSITTKAYYYPLSNYELNLNCLITGIYIVKIFNKNKQISSFRILI